MHATIKNKAQLEQILGKNLANNLLKKLRKSSMKRLPFSISFTKTKPQFCLDDGELLSYVPVNLTTGEVGEEIYGGSYDSIMHHVPEQLGEGRIAMPKDAAIIFVNNMWNGRNRSWALTVVSENVIGQIGVANAI